MPFSQNVNKTAKYKWHRASVPQPHPCFASQNVVRPLQIRKIKGEETTLEDPTWKEQSSQDKELTLGITKKLEILKHDRNTEFRNQSKISFVDFPKFKFRFF